MYAIIEDSGTQFRVEEGQTVEVDLRDADQGAKVTFDRVLVVADDQGIRVGKPLVDGAKVTGEVVGTSNGPKIEVVQVRRRKRSRRHIGHKQHYLTVRITGIKA